MKRALTCSSIVFLLLLSLCADAWAQRKPASKPQTPAPRAKKPAAKVEDETVRRSELEEIARLSPSERVERLQAYLRANAGTPTAARAAELLAVARAALGDEMLRANERRMGVELFRAAVAEAPEPMADKLFFEVLSQLPANLYLLGEREAAIDLARAVEERAADSAPRLLSVAAFYLSAELADEAARLAERAVASQPELAAAHQALGAAYRVGLRLEDAAASFRRAVEIDPQSAGARRSLADLLRATGRADEALALYRRQLEDDPQDVSARTGLVLSLFGAGKRAEAERELEAALFNQAGNLPLLVGSAYWYAARGEGARALELSERAIALEPRYRWVWARVAHARALLALNRPLEAERSLRAAREWGSFPTLDYELAAALAAAGLYDEAAEELSRSFTIRDGHIETRLAGRLQARAQSFGELLAPERRAGLFQFEGAETPAREKMLKALLAFNTATNASSEGGADAREASRAAREFASGDDALRAYRNLYTAIRLAERRVAGRAAFEQAEAAITGVEAALSAPLAPIALFADDLRELRVAARESGEEMIVPDIPRERLSKVMRGRIEEAAGWALYHEGQTAEAVVRLRRAVSVLPENTEWWRNAQWRLGVALEASGGQRDALAAYVRSYKLAPDPTRRAVIESLFRRLNNGSTAGLEALLDERETTIAGNTPPVPVAPAPAETPIEARPEAESRSAEPQPAENSEAGPQTETEPQPSPAETPASEPVSTPDPTPEPEAARVAASSNDLEEKARIETGERGASEKASNPTPTEAATPTPSPATSPRRDELPSRAETETRRTETEPVQTQVARAETGTRPRRSTREAAAPRGSGGETCKLVVGEEPLTIKGNGGSATFTVMLENYTGTTAPRFSPSTVNWADIVILAEPRSEADGHTARFTVASTSGKPGTYLVTVNSPCGKQQVSVNVQ